ncbi:uncharacterized protein FIBRA_09111 [Fibroporia radiculosa]|uniref:Scavenger mRNA decapping enzyme n=1 Tax=Fibroporia radiculosa TaxID=599839 RepID=J4GXY6_9APHY|nr:uncharacterized protein FIBRA_09111 [Fibroporia radiculosa]CCM06810.1 predicted protein [Fibroporia radiculosa]
MSFQPTDLASLQTFQFERLLNEDPIARSLTLLGTFPAADTASELRSPAIVRLETSALPSKQPEALLSKLVNDTELIGRNDIYTWLHGWLEKSRDRPDVKLNIICPATEVHIRKASAGPLAHDVDSRRPVFRTKISDGPRDPRSIWAYRAALYRCVPEITHAVVSRVRYHAFFHDHAAHRVVDILEGRSEADNVLHRDSSAEHGYVLLPDMKWDVKTLSSLYLVAISSSPAIRSLRDLRKDHVDMLRSIRREATRVVKERWGLGAGSLRMYVHYQPSYYHFHVHIVNVEFQGLLGMSVGQAHLLDDVISMLELDSGEGPSVFQRMTLTYALGEQHGLFGQMSAAQEEVEY